MTYNFPKIIRPRKRIRGLFLILSNADKNGARFDFETAASERSGFPPHPETCPTFQHRHLPHGAQEARQRVFIASEGSDTGSGHKNATAARWQAGVDSGTTTQ